MAYDRSKNLKDFNEFFTIHIIKERDISKFNVASKIPEMILKSIKHEYGTKDTGSKGLFSNDRIMAYLLVFDYEDTNSLNDVLELYLNIFSDESIKTADEKFKTVKVFICNKYPWIIDEVDEDIPYHDVVKSYMENDPRTEEIINKIQERVQPYTASRMTFFTSCKYNLGVKNLLNCVFNEIKHKEALWQKITFEPKKEVLEEEENEDHKEDEASTGFFCCKRSKKMENKLEESAIKNQSFQDRMRFKDEDDIDYDKNQTIDPKQTKIGSNEEEKEVKKEGFCAIY
jgi:hypothetical protein